MIDLKTYVVHDYDYVAYAGPCLEDAKDFVRDLDHIQVWQDGKKIAYIRHEFQKGWVTKDWC